MKRNPAIYKLIGGYEIQDEDPKYIVLDLNHYKFYSFHKTRESAQEACTKWRELPEEENDKAD